MLIVDMRDHTEIMGRVQNKKKRKQIGLAKARAISAARVGEWQKKKWERIAERLTREAEKQGWAGKGTC